MIKDSQEHLNEVNETYLQHMRIAFKIGFTMLVTGVFCLIHGLIQDFLKKLAAIKLLKCTRWFQEIRKNWLR